MQQQCVAVIRHSKRPALGTIAFGPSAWEQFLTEARTERASGSAITSGVAELARTADGGATVRGLPDGPMLSFDAGEWSAFVAGARDGEFNFAGSTPHLPDIATR